MPVSEFSPKFFLNEISKKLLKFFSLLEQAPLPPRPPPIVLPLSFPGVELSLAEPIARTPWVELDPNPVNGVSTLSFPSRSPLRRPPLRSPTKVNFEFRKIGILIFFFRSRSPTLASFECGKPSACATVGSRPSHPKRRARTPCQIWQLGARDHGRSLLRQHRHRVRKTVHSSRSPSRARKQPRQLKSSPPFFFACFCAKNKNFTTNIQI